MGLAPLRRRSARGESGGYSLEGLGSRPSSIRRTSLLPRRSWRPQSCHLARRPVPGRVSRPRRAQVMLPPSPPPSPQGRLLEVGRPPGRSVHRHGPSTALRPECRCSRSPGIPARRPRARPGRPRCRCRTARPGPSPAPGQPSRSPRRHGCARRPRTRCAALHAGQFRLRQLEDLVAYGWFTMPGAFGVTDEQQEGEAGGAPVAGRAGAVGQARLLPHSRWLSRRAG